MAAPTTSIGLLGGARCVVQGTGWIVSTPATWRHAMVPIVAFLVLVGLASALGIWGAFALAHAIVGSGTGALATALGWVLELVLGAIALLVSLVIALALAQPISGFALEAIARAQGKALDGREWPRESAGALGRSLGVTLTGLALGLPPLMLLTLVGVVFPPAAVVTVPLKLIVTALMIAWDLLDYPFSVRGLSAAARLQWMRAHLGAVIGFGLASGVLFLVPGLGLLLLPGGVAGATRLVMDVEGRPRLEAPLTLARGARSDR